MSLISTLEIALRGDTGQLDKALDKSSKKVGDFSKSGGGAGGGLGGAGALAGPWGMAASAIGGALMSVGSAALDAGKELAHFIAESMQDIDQLARAAQMLGITTGALAGLQHGAALAGVGAEEMTHALAHFQRELASASQGGAEANAIFNRLGLSANDLKDMPLEQAIAAVGDAMRATGGDADQLQTTLALFGKSSGPLKELLKGGSAEMAAMQESAKALGLAVSGEQAAQVQQATRGWRAFEQAITGIGRSLAVIFAPAVQQVTELINNFAGQGASALSSEIKFWQQMVSVVWDFTKAALEVGVKTSGLYLIFEGLSKIIGAQGLSWNEWKQLILHAAWTAQFYLGNWREAAELQFAKAALAAIKFGTTVSEVFAAIPKSFDALMEAMKSGDFSGLGDKIKDAFKDAFNRPATDWEQDMAKAIEGKEAGLKQNLAEFLAAKFNEFNRAGKVDVVDKGDGLGNVLGKRPAAMEAGSAAAFSVLFGTEDRQAKALNVANDQLKTQKMQLIELQNIRKQKLAIARARL